jgi:hypothetical protein
MYGAIWFVVERKRVPWLKITHMASDRIALVTWSMLNRPAPGLVLRPCFRHASRSRAVLVGPQQLFSVTGPWVSNV